MPLWSQYDFEVEPYYMPPRRQRTGRTPPPPPPPISPLGSPPEFTPPRPPPIPPFDPQRPEFSPQKYPYAPIFNVREVHTPPAVLLSPFYGHSTPKGTRPDYWPPGGRTPESEARWRNWKRRREAFEKLSPDKKQIFSSPVRNRQDADSLFEEDLVPWIPKTPPPSPKYPRAETPARSPAVELMREEIKKDDERTKYTHWYHAHAGQAALRDVVMHGIHSTLEGCFPGIDYKKLNVYQTIGLLSEYLRHITEKLLTQNLELPPLATNNPALSILEQKRISIRRIIGEYEAQYNRVRRELDYVKREIQKVDPPEAREYRREWREIRKNILKKDLDIERRMERIVARRGLCFLWCPHMKNKNHYERENRPLETELDELKLRIVELEAECMEAMADMTQFVDVVSPNFLKNLAGFIRTLFPSYETYPIPPEAYEEAAKDLSKHLRRIFKQKRQEWVDANREVNTLYPMIKEKREELDRIKTDIENCKKENLKLRVEFKKYKSHSQNMEWMIKEARGMLEYYEQEYAGAYQALNREKKRTAELEAELGMTPRGPPEIYPEKEPPRTSSPIITHPKSPTIIVSPPGEAIDSPVYASSPAFRSSPLRQETTMTPDSLGGERPPSAMLNISDLSGSGGSAAAERTLRAHVESGNLDDELPPSAMLDFSGLQGGESFLDSLEGDASSIKKTFSIPSPGQREQVQIDVEIIPQDIRRSPSGQRVVCDVAVELQEAAFKPPRRIEKRYKVVRGTPPISQTVGRRVDRRYGMFTPRTVIRRGHVGVRRPLFAGDFESPDSPWGTGRRTHPELMDLPQHAPSPRPPRLDTTIEWENPEMNTPL
ncbi:hypothetical protein AVEN_100785-1 [Araneus ventricosus]|uniref:Uncharacterized protein n=1 Tax=Araneus ventricosus TaxID=182803 RepID=A0A4Y2AUY4_ARAVE|nr:hypothetical protein AVEN_100785-1 [Araneus ventricosus]